MASSAGDIRKNMRIADQNRRRDMSTKEGRASILRRYKDLLEIRKALDAGKRERDTRPNALPDKEYSQTEEMRNFMRDFPSICYLATKRPSPMSVERLEVMLENIARMMNNEISEHECQRRTMEDAKNYKAMESGSTCVEEIEEGVEEERKERV
jgi:hypothetical protein